MRILCRTCGDPVSTEVPDDTILSVLVQCPECAKVEMEAEAEAAAEQLYEAMKAAWLDGYDEMLLEVTRILVFLPEEAECGRPTKHVREILNELRRGLPIWREISAYHREFQAKHGRRECDMQNRWLNDKEVTP